MKKLLLHLICLRANALPFIAALALSLGRIRIKRGIVWAHCPWLRVGGITLGPHVVLLRDFDAVVDTRPFRTVDEHEEGHCAQAQAVCVASLPVDAAFVALLGPWALVGGALSWLIASMAAYAHAWLVGRPVYAGSTIEEAQYLREYYLRVKRGLNKTALALTRDGVHVRTITEEFNPYLGHIK